MCVYTCGGQQEGIRSCGTGVISHNVSGGDEFQILCKRNKCFKLVSSKLSSPCFCSKTLNVASCKISKEKHSGWACF